MDANQKNKKAKSRHNGIVELVKTDSGFRVTCTGSGHVSDHKDFDVANDIFLHMPTDELIPEGEAYYETCKAAAEAEASENKSTVSKTED